MSHLSVFKTPEGEARYLAAYDAAMKAWPVRQTLNRDDALSGRRAHRRDTGDNRPSTHEHSTGAALSLATTVLGPCQLEILAQDFQERTLGLGVHGALLSVDRESKLRHSVTLLNQGNIRSVASLTPGAMPSKAESKPLAATE